MLLVELDDDGRSCGQGGRAAGRADRVPQGRGRCDDHRLAAGPDPDAGPWRLRGPRPRRPHRRRAARRPRPRHRRDRGGPRPLVPQGPGARPLDAALIKSEVFTE